MARGRRRVLKRDLLGQPQIVLRQVNVPGSYDPIFEVIETNGKKTTRSLETRNRQKAFGAYYRWIKEKDDGFGPGLGAL